MPEYKVRCANPMCNREDRHFQSIMVWTQHRDTMNRGARAAVDQVKAMPEGADRSLLCARIRKFASERDRIAVDAFLAGDARALDSFSPESTGIDFPCRFCHHPYVLRVWDAESAPVVIQESGTWPKDYPAKLAGKHYGSRDEKMQQIATLTPGLVLAETQQEVHARPIKPKTREAVVASEPVRVEAQADHPLAPVPVEPEAQPVPETTPTPPPVNVEASDADRVAAWFQGIPGSAQVSQCASDLGMDSKVVRDVVGADRRFKKWYGDRYEWKRPLRGGAAHAG